MEKLSVLDLFFGIGGFSLGLERTGGFETVAICEIEKFCIENVAEVYWPGVPIAGDIRGLRYDSKTRQLLWQEKVIYVGPIDLICGGPPCQPASRAGKQLGKEDDRWLWGETIRLVEEALPRWVCFENPPGIYDVGIGGILSQLEGCGYSNNRHGSGQLYISPIEIPACAKNAPHIRNRVCILAYRENANRGQGIGGHQDGTKSRRPEPSKRGDMVNTAGVRRREGKSKSKVRRGRNTSVEPSVLGDANTKRKSQSQRNVGEFGRRNCDASGSSDLADSDRKHDDAGRYGTGQDCRQLKEPSDLPGSQGHWDDYEWILGADGKLRRVKPGLRLLANEVPNRVAKLKGFGNAIIPQIPEEIGYAILAAEGQINK